MHTSTTYLRHAATLERGEIGQTFIRGVVRASNRRADHAAGLSVSHCYSGMATDEIDALRMRVARMRPRIEPGQSAKGRAWLHSARARKHLGERERAIVAAFSHFTLDGFRNLGGGGRRAYYLPVYGVHAKDGRSFAYCVGSWQSGVPLSIVS